MLVMPNMEAIYLAAQALTRDARNEHFNLCLLSLDRLENRLEELLVANPPQGGD